MRKLFLIGTSLCIVLLMGMFLFRFVQAQDPPVVPHYSPSVPTPGITELQQLVTDLHSEVDALRSVSMTLITSKQDAIIVDMGYLNSVNRTDEFTKQAYTNGGPGLPSRGYVDISDLLIEAQTTIDAWERVKDSIAP